MKGRRRGTSSRSSKFFCCYSCGSRTEQTEGISSHHIASDLDTQGVRAVTLMIARSLLGRYAPLASGPVRSTAVAKFAARTEYPSHLSVSHAPLDAWNPASTPVFPTFIGTSSRPGKKERASRKKGKGGAVLQAGVLSEMARVHASQLGLPCLPNSIYFLPYHMETIKAPTYEVVSLHSPARRRSVPLTTTPSFMKSPPA